MIRFFCAKVSMMSELGKMYWSGGIQFTWGAAFAAVGAQRASHELFSAQLNSRCTAFPVCLVARTMFMELSWSVVWFLKRIPDDPLFFEALFFFPQKKLQLEKSCTIALKTKIIHGISLFSGTQWRFSCAATAWFRRTAVNNNCNFSDYEVK